MWLIVGLLIAAIVAWWLYSGRHSQENINRLQRYLLMALRSVALFVLIVVLVDVTIKNEKQVVQQPTIVLAYDNSLSLSLSSDSVWIKNSYRQFVDDFAAGLKNNYNVEVVSFGETVKQTTMPVCDEQVTNLSAVFDYVATNLYGQNVSALVIASDGIVNQGSDPIHKSLSFNKPIYTLALGDTMVRPDLLIDKVVVNKSVYQGNQFPLVVYVKGNLVPESNYTITIKKANKVVDKRTIAIKKNFSFVKQLFYLSDNELGLQKYTIAIDVPHNDVNPRNNQCNIVVDVNNVKQEVLLLQNSWHPDVAAISQVLQKNERYNLTIEQANSFNGDLSKYSLLILNQLPSGVNNVKTIVEQAKKLNLPMLVMIGEQTDVSALKALNIGIDITQRRNDYDNVYPQLNPDFALFNLGFEQQYCKTFPPLNVPYGDYAPQQSSQVLFYQRIGEVTTNNQLIYFVQNANQKVGVVAGEGVWRWRLADYAMEKSHSITNELITKIIQYLCSKEHRERFVVEVDDVIPMYRNVVFDAVLYNNMYEQVPDVDIFLELTDSTQNKSKSVFRPTEFGYELNIGQKPAGKYSYVVTANYGEETFTKKGEFVVVAESIEANNLQANYGLLNQLATEHGGTMFTRSQISELTQAVTNNNYRSVITTSVNYLKAIDTRWLLLLALLILSVEWFLRKFWGID